MSIASAWAFTLNAELVAYGAQKGDTQYPDCRPEFSRKLAAALNQGEIDGIKKKIRKNIKIWSPYSEGISKSDLVPANIEFHHDQIVEDQLELQFGFTVDELTWLSRSELLTPAAHAGEATDGNQTRPGSGNSHDHGNHDHGGGGMDGMMPLISVSDVVVTEGTTGNVSTGALSTLGNQIVNESGQSVCLAGVNWFGFETTNFAPHGLWSRGL